MDLAITVIRSRRRTLALEIRPDCTVIVRAPLSCTDAEVRRFVSLKEAWILKHLEKMQSETGLSGRDPETPEHLSRQELEALAEAAMKDLPERCAKFAPLVGCTPRRGQLRPDHHPEPEDPLGQLQRRRKPEFQLSADDGPS